MEAYNGWDWEKFRREAAKDILCAILSNPNRNKSVQYGHADYRDNEYAREAIKQADELIKQLRNE